MDVSDDDESLPETVVNDDRVSEPDYSENDIILEYSEAEYEAELDFLSSAQFVDLTGPYMQFSEDWDDTCLLIFRAIQKKNQNQYTNIHRYIAISSLLLK